MHLMELLPWIEYPVIQCFLITLPLQGMLRLQKADKHASDSTIFRFHAKLWEGRWARKTPCLELACLIQTSSKLKSCFLIQTSSKQKSWLLAVVRQGSISSSIIKIKSGFLLEVRLYFVMDKWQKLLTTANTWFGFKKDRDTSKSCITHVFLMFFVAHLRLQAIIHHLIVIMGHPAQMPTPSQKKTSYPGFIWGTSGETSGLLGDKVGITRGDKKGLGVKNNESVTISDLNNDGKGDFLRTLLKVKTLLCFWGVNFSEGGSRSFKVFDVDRANLLKQIWEWYWSSKSILQGKHHERICGSFGGDVNLMEFSQVLTLTFSESNKNTSSILKSSDYNALFSSSSISVYYYISLCDTVVLLYVIFSTDSNRICQWILTLHVSSRSWLSATRDLHSAASLNLGFFPTRKFPEKRRFSIVFGQFTKNIFNGTLKQTWGEWT